MEGKIRTVLGDINPDQAGAVDTHDHLIKLGGHEVRQHKDFLMDSVEAGSAELKEYLQHAEKFSGFKRNTMVCMDPIGAGRGVPEMLKIANQNKNGNVVMATGFLTAAFYDTRISFLAQVPTDKVVEMMVAEIEEGMDKYSYCGPVVERVKAKAGVIKAATGYDGIHPFEKKNLEVAAKTSLQTGCPILVHTQLGTSAYEVTQIMTKKFKVHPERIAISHLNKNPNKYYWKKVMDSGVFISVDGPDRVKYYPDSVQAENIKWLCDQGYADQIMLAMDAGRIYYQHHYSKLHGKHESEGIKYLFTRFIPLLQEIGVSKSDLNKIMIENPKRWLTFTKTNK